MEVRGLRPTTYLVQLGSCGQTLVPDAAVPRGEASRGGEERAAAVPPGSPEEAFSMSLKAESAPCHVCRTEPRTGLIWDLGEDVPSLFSSMNRDCLTRLPWGDQGTHGVVPGVHGLCGVRLSPCPCSVSSSPTSSHSSWGICGRRIRGPLETPDVLTYTFEFPLGTQEQRSAVLPVPGQ